MEDWKAQMIKFRLLLLHHPVNFFLGRCKAAAVIVLADFFWLFKKFIMIDMSANCNPMQTRMA
jgi:hypothetical protein